MNKVNNVKDSDSSRANSFIYGVKTSGLIKSSARLIIFLILTIIISIALIFFISRGFSKTISIAIFLVFFSLAIFEAITLKRIASVKTRPIYKSKDKKIMIDPREKIIKYFTGIMRYGSGSGSYSFFGTGRNIAPENSLIFTDKNIWAVVVPIEGSGKVISGTDISKWQWIAMQEDIEKILSKKVSTMKFKDLIENCLDYIKIPFNNINKITLSDISNGFTITTKDGDKYSYSVRNKKDYKDLKDLLNPLIRGG